MGGLAERDLRALLAGAEVLAGIDESEDLVAAVFEAAHRLVSCEVVFWNEMDFARPASAVLSDPPEMVTESRNATWERLMHEHPVVAHATRTGDPSARRISEFLDRRARGRLELFRELYDPIGIADQVNALVHVSPTRGLGVGLARGGRDFDDRERSLLDSLRPHLASAERRVRARAALRRLVARLDEALAVEGKGLVEVDETGRVRYATREARRLLRRHGSKRELPPSGGPVVVTLLGDGYALLEERADPLSRLPLTRREREVADRAARGETSGEIGEALMVSPRTVNKHLEHVYDKLGVRGRRELRRLLQRREGAPRGAPSSRGEASAS